MITTIRSTPEEAYAEKEDMAEKRELLGRAMQELDNLERLIVFSRHLSNQPKSLDQLGIYFGLSRKEVQKLETKAIEKLTELV